MGLWEKMIKFVLGHCVIGTNSAAEEQKQVRVMFLQRYRAFQDLLEQNNKVLELMADMEEKRFGEYLFDRHYVVSRVNQVFAGVAGIVENLNRLSDGKYQQLQHICLGIREKTEEAISHAGQIPPADFCIPINHLSADMVRIAGGKMANLGEIKNRLVLSVPDGFCITSAAFKQFIEHNNLAGKIQERLASFFDLDFESMNAMSVVVQDMIRVAEVPDEIRQAVREAMDRLRGEQPGPVMTAVRSSAVHEDGAFSFAGQYTSFLNVPEEQVIDRYKDVLASLFSPRAIFYFKTKQFCESDLVMAVGVLRMIPAVAGGVLYTGDPNASDQSRTIINAVYGIGLAAVDGSVHPDSYVVSEGSVIEEQVATDRGFMFVCTDNGGIAAVDLPGERKENPVLTREQMRELWDIGTQLEKHFGAPQDVEWAIDSDQVISILQSRPLRMYKTGIEGKAPPRMIPGRVRLLDRGAIACKGIGFGRAFVCRREEDLENFPDGAVLVARHTSTRFVTVMNRAAAIITDVGGVAGHMASLSREYQVPTIVDAVDATAVIKHGEEITVDAVNCTVYQGLVEELRPYVGKKRKICKETHLFLMFENALRWITPLNLVDPDSPDFKPESCRTFHDIARFSHEKSMIELFVIGTEQEKGKSHTIPLNAGIPIDAHIYDIEGGIRPGAETAWTEDILSVPFKFFVKGMQQMKWPGPTVPDVKGFMGLVAHTAMMSESELRRTGEKSFAVVSENYMNFSIRLGYHFSQVEAYAGDNLNDNYIRFFFTGGGAVRDRRIYRVRLIRTLLERMDFRVKVHDDIVRATLMKYSQPAIESRLEVMGKLTAYTKQLDMALFNDAVTDWYIDEFVQDHMKELFILPASATLP